MALYVPACPNWATMTWTYGPADIRQATAGGQTGVPYCLSADGVTHIQPTFVQLPDSFAQATFPGVMDSLFGNWPLIQLLITGGFDADSFQMGLGGVVVLFCVGLGIGHVAGIVRKAR